MIYLEEKKCNKLAGLSSIFVTFEYNQKIVDILKTCDCYYYDKKTHAWEVSVTNLARLLDELVYIDELELKLLKDEESTKIERVVNYVTKPFQYQLEGIEYGLNKDKWLLLDAPGLGKTMSMIDLAEELHAQKNVKHCLIICGVNSLKGNWKREITKHSHLDCMILGEKITKNNKIVYGSIKERAEQLMNKIDEFFIITNIESFRDKEVVDAFNKSINNIDMIIVDEIHKCKDPSSKQGENILKLHAKYKVGLTGTIIKNNPLDAYVPLKWTDNINCGITMFKKQFCIFGGIGGYQIIGYKNMELFKDILNSCSLRRTKDLLASQLPPKNIINEIVTLSDSHRKFYDDVVNGVKTSANKVTLNTSSVRTMIIRLRQATACPSVLTTQNIVSSKIERAVDLAAELLSNNEKVVIFSMFKETCKELAKQLKEYNPAILNGDTDKSIVDSTIVKFQTDLNCKLLIATCECMGTGHSLHQQCSYAIFIDTPWTYADYLQCQDRIHRLGSTKPVFIYNLICENTVDELVNKIVSRKEAIGDYIVDDKLSESTANILSQYIQDL